MRTPGPHLQLKGYVMAEATLEAAIPHRVHTPNRTWDHVFFTTMIVLMWATVLFGFSRTYYLAGMVRAPLPNLLIHLHGAVFTLWMVLLLVQTTLITTRKIQVHRKLGLVGFGLAVAMVVLGMLAAVDAMRRHVPHLGLDPQAFLVIPMSDMLAFSLLVYMAYRMRSRAEQHKRYILIASIALMDAGVGRWPVAFLQTHPPAQDLVLLALLLAVVAFDLLQLHRVSRATVYGGTWLVILHLVRVPLGQSALWQAFARHLG